MLRIQKYLIILTTLVGCFAFVGCDGGYTKPTISTSRPSYAITIDQLASRLGLTVQKAGAPYFELTNSRNRVLLFTYQNGRVYVNGTAVCPIGTVTQSGGSTYVSELLVPKIRSRLLTSYIPPVIPPVHRAASGTVVIDPGHGGHDPGAKSILGYWEKGVNLQISRNVVSYLEQSGINVVMTRNNDTYPELEERAALANRIGADLFVSIHCNTIANNTHRGAILFIARSASWISKKTARNIKSSFSAAGIQCRGIQNQDFRVLVQTRCPAVLIECGFMTNYEEADLLDDNWYQDKLARAIADGIIKSL